VQDSIDIINMIASENIAPKWERHFHRSALIVAGCKLLRLIFHFLSSSLFSTANAYEEYMVDTMIPLIFDDMGIPEEHRATVLERIHQQRAKTRGEYFATYGAEMDRVESKPYAEEVDPGDTDSE
jgi:hypothetical protein